MDTSKIIDELNQIQLKIVQNQLENKQLNIDYYTKYLSALKQINNFSIVIGEHIPSPFTGGRDAYLDNIDLENGYFKFKEKNMISGEYINSFSIPFEDWNIIKKKE